MNTRYFPIKLENWLGHLTCVDKTCSQTIGASSHTHTVTVPSESSFRDCDHLCHLNSKSFHWGNTSIWTVTSRTVTIGLFKNTKLIAVFSFCIKSLQGILKCYKIIHSCGVVLDRACSQYSRACPCRTITVDMWELIRGIWCALYQKASEMEMRAWKQLQGLTSAKHSLGSVTVLSTVACGCGKAPWWTVLCRHYCLETAFTLKIFWFYNNVNILSHLCILRTLNGEYKSMNLGSSLPVLEDALLCSGRFSSGVSWEAVLLLLNMYSINVGFLHVS